MDQFQNPNMDRVGVKMRRADLVLFLPTWSNYFFSIYRIYGVNSGLLIKLRGGKGVERTKI